MMAAPSPNPLKVGLTGGVASGKSLAADAFRRLGVTVVDSDDLAREVVEPGSDGLAALTGVIGNGFLDKDGRLDRPKLRDAIFREPSLRQRVEAILHPRILDRLQQRMEAASGDYVIGVVPLLDESLKHSLFQRVVVVDCPVARQLERLMSRDGETRESAHRILDSQPTREDRLALADEVLENDAAVDELDKQVVRLHETLSEFARAASQS